MRKFIYLSSIMAFFVLNTISIYAANTIITGTVRDAFTGESLIGANVVLVGTSMGAATDMNGKYLIPKVVPGNYTMRVSYIGYGQTSRAILIKDGDVLIEDFRLEPVGIEGKEIVVTGQAYGQTQAINQQLSSNQISNVVSQSKIQELPDNTVAESVGRLPGVTVIRTGGEGNQVVVRGLSPKFNQITIDGIQMSSSNPNDRSADLSMISSNMLDGIQVTKSVTPDMDAEVVGGTINFQLREAKANETGRPQINLMTQGSYNGLSNAYNKFNNYKYVGSIEDRFLEGLFGVFAQFDVERKNLTSNEFNATYDHKDVSTTEYITTGLNLYNIPRDRNRINLALVMDYLLPDGKLKFSNFVSSGKTVLQNRYEGYYINTTPTTINQHQYLLSSANSTLSSLTNSLDFDQQLPIFHLSAKFSHTYSETKNPNDWTVTFVQSSAGIGGFTNATGVNPIDIPKAANNDLSKTYLSFFTSSNSLSRQRALLGQADFDANVNLSEKISANIKFGGKFRYQTRDYLYQQFGGQGLSLQSAIVVDNLIASHLGLPGNLGSTIPIAYFTDPGYDYGKFLNGDYTMINPLNYGMLSTMGDLLRNNVDYFAQNGGAIAFARDNYNSTTNNYRGKEYQSAFYLMSVINIGEEITLIPGVRYQNLRTSYTAPRGNQQALSYYTYQYYDTTVDQSHGYWLPDVSLKYKPFAWMDIRLAYSNTVAYPDYVSITPRIDVGFGTINYNRFNLKPSRSTNYDVYVSFYENSIGLFTIGGFLKEIKDLIYPWYFFVSGNNALPYYPPSLPVTSPPSGTYRVNTYVNDPFLIKNYGMELDWQTHFWYLPGPLSGLVFNINYTHIFSKAQYPFTYRYQVGRNAPVYIDTFYVDRLLNQPNDIINLSLGFDYAGFSARVSMLYQTDVFTGNNFWPQLRSGTAAYRRWDLALKQDIPWFGIQLFGNLNNINGARDISRIQGGGIQQPNAQQDYGMTADFGVRLKL